MAKTTTRGSISRAQKAVLLRSTHLKRLAEQEAVMCGDIAAAVADQKKFCDAKISAIVEGNKRREAVLKAALKAATSQMFGFEVPRVSPEAATRWLALHDAKDVFMLQVEVTFITPFGFPLIGGFMIGLSGNDLKEVLSQHMKHSTRMVEVAGDLFPGPSFERAQAGGIKTEVQFVDKGPDRLPILQGMITMPGMSDEEIDDLLKNGGSPYRGGEAPI